MARGHDGPGPNCTLPWTLTTSDVDDASQVDALLDHVDGPVASFTADGAYDQEGVYGEDYRALPRGVRHRPTTLQRPTERYVPTMRDRHLKIISERGRIAWQKAAGYNWRDLVEADINRFERVIGTVCDSATIGVKRPRSRLLSAR